MNVGKFITTVVLILAIVLPAVIMTIPVTQYALAQVTFNVINIIPTTSAYEGRVARVYCDGSQCCSNVWGCPNLWAVVQIGNATMDPNVWGWEHLYRNYASRIGTGSTTMSISSGRVVVNSQWTIKEHPEYNTMAYHEVIYGAKPWGNQIINHQFLQLPKRISELPRILVGVYYDLKTGVPGNNFAFEAWIFTDGNNGRAAGPGDYEIMVQLYIEGGYPAGTSVAEYVVPILVDGQLVYQTFVMYDCRTDAGWRFFTFRSTTNYVGKHVVFDYYEFIKIANSYVGGALTKMYLMALEFGTEVYTNRCSSFPCTVNVQWTLNRYYFATTSSSISLVDALSEWAKVLTGTTPTTSPVTTTTPKTTTTTTTTTKTTTTTTTTPTTTTTATSPTPTTTTTTTKTTKAPKTPKTTTTTTTTPTTTTTATSPTPTTTTTTTKTTTTTTSAPGVRYSFTLNANSRVATVSNCIEFRVSGGSTTIGGVAVSSGSVLKICVNNDNALTWWIGADGWLSANDLDVSAVYVNGNQVLSNTKISLSGIQADLSTISSTLTITVTGTGWTSLTWNGQTVISGTDSRTLTISGVAPTTSKAMNLNIGTTTIYADATATNYTLQ
jgi:hypothetical protein